MRVTLPKKSTREVWGVDDGDMPATAVKKDKHEWHRLNVKLVTDELYAVGARHLASVKGPNGGTLDFYAANTKVVIVQEYRDQSGLEVYVPLTISMKMPEVVEKLREYIGPKEEGR